MSSIQTTNQPRFFISLVMLMIFVFGMAAPQWVHAATLTVDSLLDENDGRCTDGDCTLREAIQVANPGDIITFSVTGSIVLSLGQLTVNKDLTINGPGPGSLIVDGNHYTKIFNVIGGITSFSGLTIANGLGGFGSGMENDGTTTLTNITFSNNSAIELGGGLYNVGTATLNNVTFIANAAKDGAGLYNIGNTILTNGAFNGNATTENNGGGIYNASTCTLANVTFSGNSAYYGGGMYNRGTTTLTNVTFSGNSANSGSCGGMINTGTATLTSVTFSNNTATHYGGGMGNDGTTTLMNVTFSENTADIGGGMYTFASSTLTNVTIRGNSASSFGGGVYVDGTGTLNVKNTLFAGNIAPTSPECSGMLTSYGYNLIQDITGCAIAGDETGNIYGKDPFLGPLTDNGGSTLTYPLLPGSPAIDAAAFTDPYGNLVTKDQRGVTRPQGLFNDIGAFKLIQVHWLWLPFVLR